MKKLLIQCFMAMLASNGLAQSDSVDYSLEGLAKACTKYSEVSSFHEGLAIVMKGDYYSGQKYGAIDKKGNEVIPCVYDLLRDFHEGLAAVKKDGKFGNRTYKYGFINTKGEIIVPYVYDDVKDFSEGHAVVQKSTDHVLYGLIDSTGKQVLPCIYDGMENLSSGVTYAYNDKLKGFINSKGKIVLRPIDKYDTYGVFSEGMCKVGESYEKYDSDMDVTMLLERCGFIDRTGKTVIRPYYDETLYFTDGLCAVKKDGKWGYVNKQGEVIVSLSYKYVHPFNEGTAAVMKENDKYILIDKNGKQILPNEYEEAHSFSEGLALVKKNGKWGFIDKNGKSTFDFQDK